MTRVLIIIAKGERIGILYNLNANIVYCNSIFIKSHQINIEIHGVNVKEFKLPIARKQCSSFIGFPILARKV